MIPKDYITEWREHAPWVQDAQVEQDLVISRALVEIFRIPDVAERLAFRGGTALYKLHLRPAARYSEDIDLVQVAPGPIGVTFDAIRAVVDPWLGEPRRVLKGGRVNLLYRFRSEDEPARPMRLKIGINSREHFTEHGHVRSAFEMRSRWWAGSAQITTFSLEEGTKLRALFQRKKGRDLYDVWYALKNGADPKMIVTCFARYMRESGRDVSRAEFEQNLAGKLEQPMKGSHPEGVDVSALDHILAGHATIGPHQGLFLEETWRLHPQICQFTSELFYEDRLRQSAGDRCVRPGHVA